MVDECMLGEDKFAVSQIGMAVLQEVTPMRCIDYPVLVDIAALDPLGVPEFAQFVVTQYSLHFMLDCHRKTFEVTSQLSEECIAWRGVSPGRFPPVAFRWKRVQAFFHLLRPSPH